MAIGYDALVKGASTRVKRGSLAMLHGTLALVLARADGIHGLTGQKRHEALMDKDLDDMREELGLKSTWYKEVRQLTNAIVKKTFPDIEFWRGILANPKLDDAIDELHAMLNAQFDAQIVSNYRLSVHVLDRQDKSKVAGKTQAATHGPVTSGTYDTSEPRKPEAITDQTSTVTAETDDFGQIVHALKRLSDAGDIDRLNQIADIVAAAIDHTVKQAPALPAPATAKAA